MDFNDAIRYMLDQDIAKYGAGFELMPVGKLRHFENSFRRAGAPVPNYQFYRESGPFRVNAMKYPDGVWREHLTGKEVTFTHFPSFDQSSGGIGDTLVWYPTVEGVGGALAVVSRDSRYPVLVNKPPMDGIAFTTL